jgi:hypothetical protein
MARVPVSEEYRTGEGGEQFPRLSKLETGEVARLCLPDNDAWAEWVHTMRAPKIEHGVAIIINKSRKDGSTYPDYSYVFVGQRICLGDPAVLEDKGIDPARCPACESAQRGIKDMKPVRRFSLPVIRYATKNPRTADLRPTPGAEVLVWGLTSKMYDQLLDCAKQMREMLRLPPEAPMNLRDMDVVVECESGDFQRLVFKPPRYPAYQDPTIGTQVAALIGALWSDVENRPTDEQLKGACGRDGDKGYMLVDVRKMEDAWRVADGGQAPSADPLNGTAPGQSQQGSVTTGLNVLLEGGRPAAAQEPATQDPGVVPPATGGDPFVGAEAGLPASNGAAAPDPFAGATQAAAPATTTATPAPAAASPSPTESPAAAPAPASDPFAGGSQAAAATPTAPAASSPPAVSPEAPAAAPPSEPRRSLSFDQILGMSGKPA